MIPQELIDSIIHEVNHTPSLKACSLVCSNFRRPSQQILLRSLTLDDYTPPNYGEASTLLTESPHVAGYIKNFGVRLTWVAVSAPSDADDFLRLLAKLTNVDQFSITADCRWEALFPVTPSVLDYIRRRKLRELHFSLVENIPASVIALSLAHASALSFSTITVKTASDQLGQLPKAGPTVTALSLFECDGVDNLLGREDLSPYTANLRTLSIRPQSGSNCNTICSAASTLENILFDLASLIRSPPYRLPYLPSLRSIHFRLPSKDYYEAPFTAMLTSFVPSIPPTLSVISVTDSGILSAERWLPSTFTTLDILLSDCATVPSLRWRVSFSRNEVGQSSFRSFEAIVQQGMPGMLEKGKLIVEWPDNMHKWPPRL
ncbi:hypothetical protein DFH08DRAFT_881049 [Mycena albidolilacea]|uniref:F-box domain-containing protein n=1 Tax=Mycena albidolilacea TaxID=1033008 RepID=A0AAD6ZPK8_9AGAR|nr:hypothetical protein DFH08DRAFT_881049 [Mycena albidolilacea]